MVHLTYIPSFFYSNSRCGTLTYVWHPNNLSPHKWASPKPHSVSMLQQKSLPTHQATIKSTPTLYKVSHTILHSIYATDFVPRVSTIYAMCHPLCPWYYNMIPPNSSLTLVADVFPLDQQPRVIVQTTKLVHEVHYFSLFCPAARIIGYDATISSRSTNPSLKQLNCYPAHILMHLNQVTNYVLVARNSMIIRVARVSHTPKRVRVMVDCQERTKGADKMSFSNTEINDVKYAIKSLFSIPYVGT